MKKYFTHDGTTQEGPFDIEDLKGLKITKETMIWYEGIDKWTKAEFILEIKDAISLTPPPFFNQSTTSTSSSENSKQENEKQHSSAPSKSNETKSTWQRVRTMLIIFLVVIGASVVFSIIRNPSHNVFMKVTIHPPNPRVVESHANEDPSSQLFSFKEGVWATILNQGGSGKVLITADLTQNNNAYQKNEEIYMNENETRTFHFIFTEPKLLGGKMTYDVTTKVIQ